MSGRTDRHHWRTVLGAEGEPLQQEVARAAIPARGLQNSKAPSASGPAKPGSLANWEQRERGRATSGEDGVAERADGRRRHAETVGGEGEDCVRGKAGAEEEEEEGKEGLSKAERASTRQSCRGLGTVSQARLKYKWEFSPRQIDAILVSEKGRLEE